MKLSTIRFKRNEFNDWKDTNGNAWLCGAQLDKIILDLYGLKAYAINISIFNLPGPNRQCFTKASYSHIKIKKKIYFIVDFVEYLSDYFNSNKRLWFEIEVE